MLDLQKINGHEIIDFLNCKEEGSKQENLSYDHNINNFQFEDQNIFEHKYILSFSADYNNWGSPQEICGNQIIITSNGKVELRLEEPFDSDDTDDILKELIENWLKTHIFEDNIENKFNSDLKKAIDQLRTIRFDNKKDLDEALFLLNRARTYQS